MLYFYLCNKFITIKFENNIYKTLLWHVTGTSQEFCRYVMVVALSLNSPRKELRQYFLVLVVKGSKSSSHTEE